MRVINGILLALLIITVITVLIIVIAASITGKQMSTTNTGGRLRNSFSSNLRGGVIFVKENGKISLPKSNTDQFIIVTSKGSVELIIPLSNSVRQIRIERKSGFGIIKVSGGKGVEIRGSSIINSGTALFKSLGSSSTRLRPGIPIQESFVRIE